jgi:hypothetical protein
MRRAGKIFSRAGIAGLSAVLSLWAAAGCSTPLVAPAGSESALVIGRVMVTYTWELALGRMRPGTNKEGILVELEDRDKHTVVRATTDEEGYFFIPNITAGAYELRRVIVGVTFADYRGGYVTTEDKFSISQGTLAFSPSPGKVGYVGTVLVEVDERGFRTKTAPDDAAAKDYFLRTWAKSPWASREVLSLRSKPAPAGGFSF